jgi:LytS/YehU family sensor histidine kinase
MHEDVQAADDMLADLSHLLRVYLISNGKQEVRLSEEIDVLDTYIRIQKRRFEGRLLSVLDIPAELFNAGVPPLLLQPLVENSILHGIATRSWEGYVMVRAWQTGSALNLEVVDNGLGLPENHAEGIGMSNTRSRLRQLYEDRQYFHIKNGDNGGVVVSIQIPLQFIPARVPDDDTNSDSGRRTARATADRFVTQSR